MEHYTYDSKKQRIPDKHHKQTQDETHRQET